MYFCLVQLLLTRWLEVEFVSQGEIVKTQVGLGTATSRREGPNVWGSTVSLTDGTRQEGVGVRACVCMCVCARMCACVCVVEVLCCSDRCFKKGGWQRESERDVEADGFQNSIFWIIAIIIIILIIPWR